MTKSAECVLTLVSRGIRRGVLLRLMCAKLARWEPFSSQIDAGEICVGSMRYPTQLDEDGCPELHDVVYQALVDAACKLDAENGYGDG